MKLQVDNSIPIVEIWEGILMPGQEAFYEFNALLETNVLENRKMICYSALPNEDVEDAEPQNNTYCEILDNDFYIISVEPNPTNKEVFISFVLKEKGYYSIDVTTIEGKTLLKNEGDNGIKGVNRIEINLTGIEEGLYLIKISDGIEFDSRKILVIK
jgi:hypothetical protein